MKASKNSNVAPLLGEQRALMALVQQFGHCEGDRMVMDPDEMRAGIDQLQIWQRTMKKILDKGGVAAVEVDGVVVTTYNLH